MAVDERKRKGVFMGRWICMNLKGGSILHEEGAVNSYHAEREAGKWTKWLPKYQKERNGRRANDQTSTSVPMPKMQQWEIRAENHSCL